MTVIWCINSCQLYFDWCSLYLFTAHRDGCTGAIALTYLLHGAEPFLKN